MESPCDRTNEKNWPLIPGLFDNEVPARLLPLGFGAVADAYRTGLLSREGLIRLTRLRGGTQPEPSELLVTFLKPSWIDRSRDIEEELARLAACGDNLRPALWMILARMILSRYSDSAEALTMLQVLFDSVGAPSELKPYTLYGGESTDGSPSAMRARIAQLSQLLKRRGL
jgi:hypothetical protein